jgi:hypothetical protein
MPPDAPEKLVRRTFALLRDAGISDRNDRLNLFRWILQDPQVTSTNDLDENELDVVVRVLSYWQKNEELISRSRMAIGSWTSGHECSTGMWHGAPGDLHECECGATWRAESYGPLDIRWVISG